MLTRLLPMLVVVVSNVLYHSTQKTIDPRANPAASLIATYVVALLGSALLFFLYPPEEGLRHAFARLNASSYLLGIGVLGIEAGFLFVYRSGWPISLAALYANALVTLLLIPLGMLWFEERLSSWNLAGIVLALTGMALMSWNRV